MLGKLTTYTNCWETQHRQQQRLAIFDPLLLLPKDIEYKDALTRKGSKAIP
jgi:hypothetical protein